MNKASAPSAHSRVIRRSLTGRARGGRATLCHAPEAEPGSHPGQAALSSAGALPPPPTPTIGHGPRLAAGARLVRSRGPSGHRKEAEILAQTVAAGSGSGAAGDVRARE